MSSTDPWGLLGKKLVSKHCKGKKAKVIMYDQTGAIRAKCKCGATYWHGFGKHGYAVKDN